MSTSAPTWCQTIAIIQEDIRRYPSSPSASLTKIIKSLYSHPSFVAVIFYRISHWAWCSRNKLAHRAIYILLRIIYPLVRWYSGVELLPRTNIGPGLCILHFGPTIIHPNTVAGKNLTLLHGVTIGEAHGRTPTLGENVTVGSRATLIGPIHIGNHVTVGAGAVVTQDLPDGCTAVGMPARPLPKA